MGNNVRVDIGRSDPSAIEVEGKKCDLNGATDSESVPVVVHLSADGNSRRRVLPIAVQSFVESCGYTAANP